MLRLLNITLVFLFATTAARASEKQLAVPLEVEPARIVVGLSPSMRLSLTNESASVVALPQFAVLRVTPATGQSFIALGIADGKRFGVPLSTSERASIGPRERASFSFRTRDISLRPDWFYDPRFLEAGTYRLQILLVDSTRGLTTSGGAEAESKIPILAASNEVLLTIDEPTGDDAIVWNRLKEALSPRSQAFDPIEWQLPTLYRAATKLVQAYPHSAYSPYLAASVRADSRVQRLEVLHRVLEAHAIGTMTDEVWQQIAYDETQLALEAELRKDAAGAIRWNVAAREHLTRLAKSDNPDVRQWSEKQLEHLPALAEIEQRLAEN